MKNWFVTAWALFVLLALPAFGVDTFREPGSGMQFPVLERASFQGEEYNLEATGASLRKKFIFKVYAIAHYMQNPPSGNVEQVIKEILASNSPKQMMMKWLRNVKKSQIVKAYRESLGNAIGPNFGQMQQGLNQFLSFYKTDAKQGDTHILRWLPGGVLELVVNGKSMGQLQDSELAEAFWRMWFGKKSVVKPAELVSRIVQ